ncbi:uncharacterized protein F5Z01DRAFT_636768 [Emericellopsis atlantica]|uniref:MARVEL domain-containing protein n=1 Tax=Emericellopsis atlantica TaxID=2614577 RepID=A0A9P7ZLY1_9HYPO|nr:uncharacterized protein F5Z01DRAFT_636768 [Emericellopsis atlantica]KAG9254106.1 hypothetical protein F5Z01DRAFT_636768 [Emericellopsis atlantica]
MSFKSLLFDVRLATKVHIVQLLLAVVVLGLAGYKGTINTGVPGGAGQITPITAVSSRALTFVCGHPLILPQSVKSIVCILYELLTRHVARLQKFGRLGVYRVLNVLDFLLWGVATGMVAYSASRYCVGEACSVTQGIIALGVIICLLSIQPACATITEARDAKKAPRAYDAEMARPRK